MVTHDHCHVMYVKYLMATMTTHEHGDVTGWLIIIRCRCCSTTTRVRVMPTILYIKLDLVPMI